MTTTNGDGGGSVELARMGGCVMCGEKKAKYRCPSCETSTCSLPCVKRHKKELQCDGVRKNAAYVPVKKMTDLHLLSDYRLLESLDRCVDSCTRDQQRKITRTNAPLPKHLHRVRKAVSQRGMRIYFMPKNFSRHKENTTLLDWNTSRISWRLDVIFLHAQQFKLVVDKCPEETTLDVVMEKCLRAAIDKKREYRKHFEAYLASKDDIEVLLKAEKVPESHNKFYLLDTGKSLKDNLVGKKIIEYPTLYVTVKGFATLTDVGKVSSSSKKLNSLLLSSYSLDGKDEAVCDSVEEEEQEPTKKKPRVGKMKHGEGDVSSCDDSDDSVDEAFSLLETGGYKDALSSLYKSAMENS